MEYKISDGTKSYITVATNSSSTIAVGLGTSIAFIEGRKVLVSDTGDYDTGAVAPDNYIYIVDFDANTCTLVLTIPQYEVDQGSYYQYERHLRNVATIKDDTGDIHLIVSSTYANFGVHAHFYDEPYPHGWSIYHKNYTDNTAWNESSYTRPFGDKFYSNILIHDYAIANNRYFCVFCYYIDDDATTGFLFHSYDISTEILSYDYDTGHAFNIKAYQANEDATDHNIYITVSFDGGTTTSIYPFDPAAVSLGALITSNASFLMASNTYMYDWNNINQVHRTVDQFLHTTISRPASMGKCKFTYGQFSILVYGWG